MCFVFHRVVFLYFIMLRAKDAPRPIDKEFLALGKALYYLSDLEQYISRENKERDTVIDMGVNCMKRFLVEAEQHKAKQKEEEARLVQQ